MPACQHASMPACLGAYGRGGRSFYVVGGDPHTKKVCPNHAERALNSQSHGARTENASASPACQHASMPACQHASMPACPHATPGISHCYPRHIALLPQAHCNMQARRALIVKCTGYIPRFSLYCNMQARRMCAYLSAAYDLCYSHVAVLSPFVFIQSREIQWRKRRRRGRRRRRRRVRGGGGAYDDSDTFG